MILQFFIFFYRAFNWSIFEIFLYYLIILLFFTLNAVFYLWGAMT